MKISFVLFSSGVLMTKHEQETSQNYLLTFPPNSIRNIGRPQRISISHGCWYQLLIRQKTSSRFLSRQCASWYSWDVILPCGFHSNALWQISFSLFCRVCPIQPNFLLLISTFMSDCPFLSHSSKFQEYFEDIY
jgi:hypothetical protein